MDLPAGANQPTVYFICCSFFRQAGNKHAEKELTPSLVLTSQAACPSRPIVTKRKTSAQVAYAHLSSSPSRPPPPRACPSSLSSSSPSSLPPSRSFNRPNKLLVSQFAATCGFRRKPSPSPASRPSPLTRSSKYPAWFSPTDRRPFRSDRPGANVVVIVVVGVLMCGVSRLLVVGWC